MGKGPKSIPVYSKQVLSMIKNGYFLPFHSEPPPFYAKNNESSLKNKKFVEDTISELLVNKCIEEVSDVPYCVNPLTVGGREAKASFRLASR